MRKMLRKIILEILADGKEYTIFQLKEHIQEKTGYIYKRDYTESQLSGVLHALRGSGSILRQDRGSYILAKPPGIKGAIADVESPAFAGAAAVSEQDIQEKTKTASLSLKTLYQELQQRLQEDYAFILQSMKHIDLSSSESEDVQVFHKLLRLRDTMQDIMEQDAN